MKKLILFLLAGSVLILSKPKWIPLFIGSEKLMVEVADTVEKRVRGLMLRKDIPENYGMLFVFDREEIQGIWMKNTLISLDIIFLDKNRQVINIVSSAPPCKTNPCPVYQSARPAKFVLELRGGRLKGLDLKAGDRIFFILNN